MRFHNSGLRLAPKTKRQSRAFCRATRSNSEVKVHKRSTTSITIIIIIITVIVVTVIAASSALSRASLHSYADESIT